MKANKLIKFLISIILVPFNSNAQPIGFLNNQSKFNAIRYEINAKRLGIDYNSKEAGTAGKEFERIDPTYYVGTLLQGTFMFYQSADFIGYRNAIPILQKSLQMMTKDYAKELQTRTSNISDYFSNMSLHKDYDYASYCLSTCFANTNQPDSAWLVVRNAQKLDLQDEMYMDTYNTLAWLVHRNRFFTNQKYSFLKNSIPENEAYANALLDSSILKVNRDANLCKDFYSNYTEQKMSGVYHYKAMLYSYALDIENANKYYDLQRNASGFSYNNFANFCGVQALFKAADENYTMARISEPTDKRLKEYVYYKSIINVYKGNTNFGATELGQFIKDNGSTSGFGWYNLALARTLLYNGQYLEAKKYISKAEHFKEVHIGTTLGQSHYDFTIGILKLISVDNQIKSIAFRNKKWWLRIRNIISRMQLQVQKYMIQYFLVNQLSANPERNNVVYKLFSTESTVSFDEIFYLIKDFSPKFFIKNFSAQLGTENRPRVKKYFKLLLAKLYMQENKNKEALLLCNDILQTENIDLEYEKLFQARLLETMALLAIKSNDQAQADNYIYSLYNLYPQLLPFSGLKPQMFLNVTGNNTIENKKICKALQSAQIRWVSEADAQTLNVEIDFNTNGTKPILIYKVTNAEGLIIVPSTKLSYATTEDAQKSLPFGLFNIGIYKENLN
jgi:hypothetical protein